MEGNQCCQTEGVADPEDFCSDPVHGLGKFSDRKRLIILYVNVL
jgi:hypothetical protein